MNTEEVMPRLTKRDLELLSERINEHFRKRKLADERRTKRALQKLKTTLQKLKTKKHKKL